MKGGRNYTWMKGCRSQMRDHTHTHTPKERKANGRGGKEAFLSVFWSNQKKRKCDLSFTFVHSNTHTHTKPESGMRRRKEQVTRSLSIAQTRY